MPSLDDVHSILKLLEVCGMTPGDFALTLLQNPTLNADAMESVYLHAKTILDCLSKAEDASVVHKWAVSTTTQICMEEISKLMHKKSRFQFLASQTSETHLRGIRMEMMATDMEKLTPTMWKLLDSLLAANSIIVYYCEAAQKRVAKLKQPSQSGGIRRNDNNGTESGLVDDDDDKYSECWHLVGDLPDCSTEQDQTEYLKCKVMENLTSLLKHVCYPSFSVDFDLMK